MELSIYKYVYWGGISRGALIPPRVDFKTFSTYFIAINDLLALKQILYDQLGGVGLYWGEIGPSKVRATAEQT